VNQFRHFDSTPWTVDRPVGNLYLHGTAQHRKKCTYIHASSGIQTHGSSARLARGLRALDRAATGTGYLPSLYGCETWPLSPERERVVLNNILIEQRGGNIV